MCIFRVYVCACAKQSLFQKLGQLASQDHVKCLPKRNRENQRQLQKDYTSKTLGEVQAIGNGVLIATLKNIYTCSCTIFSISC